MNDLQIENTNDILARAGMYKTLSLAFLKEPSIKFVEYLRSPAMSSLMSEMGLPFDDVFLNTPASELIENLAEKYTNLFLGPGAHISLQASVHSSKEETKQLWGISTCEFVRFFGDIGLELREDSGIIPDHISAQLEVMQKLCQFEANARQNRSDNVVVETLNYEKELVSKHLLSWCPIFCGQIEESGVGSPYQELATLTHLFLLSENQSIKLSINSNHEVEN